MKNLSIMIKPASSVCNLRCKYCFYADVSSKRSVKSCGIMKEDTLRSILKNIESELTFGDKINFAFQGGEPTIAGLSFFENFVSEIKKWKNGAKVSYALQTNAILINEDWCKFLKKNNFLVGVSLDILQESHDSVRVDDKGGETYKKVLNSIKLLEEHKVEYNVLCTLTNSIARHPQQVWDMLCKLGIMYVQFTPCLGDLGDSEQSPYALTPKRFASFYSSLFQYWLKDYKCGKYRSIKFFDDVINLILFGSPTACGMDGRCRPQLVVEADGSAYPCDFYCIDEYKLGSLKESGFMALLNSEIVKKFLNRTSNKPQLCTSCRYKAFCGGNCQRMQKEICFEKSGTYCGYQDFLNRCGDELMKIADEQRRKLMMRM